MRRISKFIANPLFSGSVIMVGGNMLVNFINYVYHIIMGRILGPVGYGVLASLYSILYIISIIPTSTGVSIVKFISSARGEAETVSIYKSINKLVLYLAIVSFLGMIIASPFIASFLKIKSVWSVVLVAPILFFTLVSFVNQSTFQGLLKFTGTVGTFLISAVIKLVAGVALVYIGWSVFGAMLGVVIGAVLSYLYSFWFIKKVMPKVKEKSFPLKPFLKYAFPVLMQALAFTSLFTTDIILVKHFLSPYSAGIYAALATLGKIIFFAASPVSATMFPIVAKRVTNKEPYLKVFWLALMMTTATSLVIVTFYYLFPDIAIGVLYGKDYLAARGELIWMGVFMLFYTISYLVVNFLLSLNRVKIVAIPLVASLLQIVLIWMRHASLLQVIQNSLMVTVAMFLALMVYLGYNYSISHAKN